MTKLHDLIDETATNFQQLGSLLEAAYAVQWDAPPNLHSERLPGEPGNPTADVALDGRRLRLRLEVLKAERMIKAAPLAVKAAEERLAAALDAWAGHTDE